MTLPPLSIKRANFVLTILLGVMLIISVNVIGAPPLDIRVLTLSGIVFSIKILLNMTATRKDQNSPLAWIFNAFTFAVLFFLTVYTIGLNERAWNGSVESYLNVYTLDPILWALAIIIVGTMLARPLARSLPPQGIKLYILWLIVFMSIVSALSTYLYPRNGMLMHYDDWTKAGMPGKPKPSDPAFWQPLMPYKFF
jgi:hypothetical protein